ncbi:MAG: alkaline phosphatase D family protein [Pseudomonadota bacterium]
MPPFSRREFCLTVGSVPLLLPAAGHALKRSGDELFAYGVASGDPLLRRVILWTALRPELVTKRADVEWRVYADEALTQLVSGGTAPTDAERGFTVKVDAGGLQPGTTYYYQFAAAGAVSEVGRTRTLPASDVERVRLGVVSCSNYPYGFFNAYGRLAQEDNIDAVLHLGDYIYEYENGVYGDGTPLDRVPDPNREIVSLDDYRRRYAQYRSDVQLQAVHARHPFIAVWDDHESTNNSWKDGAENHNPELGEGDWETRKRVSIKAYFEWMPVRERPWLPEQERIYRAFRFGRLADLTMLDTRLIGRDEQLPIGDPGLADPSRELIGVRQENWLKRRLAASQQRQTRWRLIGQQVVFSQVSLDQGVSTINTDQWDGYAPARDRILEFIETGNIDNVVILTGDIHSSWGNEIARNPFDPAGYSPLATEFVTPAVTSPAIEDEDEAAALAALVQGTNPQVKYLDLFRRGYMVVDITPEQVQTDWYHLNTIDAVDDTAVLAQSLRVLSGSNELQSV